MEVYPNKKYTNLSKIVHILNRINFQKSQIRNRTKAPIQCVLKKVHTDSKENNQGFEIKFKLCATIPHEMYPTL
jgi:hypothetical protein